MKATLCNIEAIRFLLGSCFSVSVCSFLSISLPFVFFGLLVVISVAIHKSADRADLDSQGGLCVGLGGVLCAVYLVARDLAKMGVGVPQQTEPSERKRLVTVRRRFLQTTGERRREGEIKSQKNF